MIYLIRGENMNLREVIAKSIMLTVLIVGLLALLRYYSVRFIPSINGTTIAISFIVAFILVGIFHKNKED